jgi:molybdopterin molybdotransferase
VIPLAEAQRFVIDACAPLATIAIDLDDALGCVVDGAVVATEAVPPFTNSAMDGYALRAQDTAGAPVELDVVGSIMAGHVLDAPLGPGQAARIMTGAPLPPGADAVVMVEQTEALTDGARVRIEHVAAVGEFVRSPGRDVAVGEVVVPAGTALTPAHLGVLANQGITQVVAHPRPRVGVLSTGDELMEGPGPLPAGKIRDANRHTLLALARRQGWEAIDLGIVGDDEQSLVDALTLGALRCDAIVTSGGVSVGDLDIVRTVLEKLCEGTMRWMQVAIRPAKPFAFGTLQGGATPVFGLPGNPVSAMVSFELFVRPALRKMGGHQRLHRPVVSCVSDEDLHRRPDGKLHLLRAQVTLGRDGTWRVRTSAGQESHQLQAMANADALALVPDGEGIDAGQRVDVLLVDPDDLNGDGRSWP